MAIQREMKELFGARSPAALQSGTALYESYFVRANHPTEDKALWVRYTTFIPKSGAPEAEIWAMLFDGDKVVAGKNEFPIEQATFDAGKMQVKTPFGELSVGCCSGKTEHKGERLMWDLRWNSCPSPVLMFKRPWYDRSFPKAKSLVLEPNVVLNGTFGMFRTRYGVLKAGRDPLTITGELNTQMRMRGDRCVGLIKSLIGC